MNDLISTQTASSLLGVSVSAVKRWADSGLLECVRTAGGHRRFRRIDVDRLLLTRHEREEFVASWFELLERGRGYEIEAQLLSERARRGSWPAVCDALSEVLAALGERWASGELSILREHLMTNHLEHALAVVSRSQPVSDDSAAALLVLPEGEEHSLGLSLAELCLHELGIQTRWAGRRTPTNELVAHLATAHIDIVVATATAAYRDATCLSNWCAQVANACRAHDITLWVGGQGPWPEPLPLGQKLAQFSQLPLCAANWRESR